MGAAAVGFAPSSGAQATGPPTGGSGAFGYQASFTIFGGGPFVFGPIPKVDLPAGGSATPITAAEPSGRVAQGPGILLTSERIEVSTEGTTGAGGSVTSKARLTSVPTSQVGEILYAGVIESTCTAAAGGTTGSVTLAGPGDGGRAGPTLRTSDGNPDIEGDETYVDVPLNPPPNTTINGNLESVGDTYKVVFNEQVKNADGSLTVYAVHEYLLGPTALGDLYIGQSRCSLADAGAPAGGGGTGAGNTATTRAAGQSGTATTVAGRSVANTGSNILPLLLPAGALMVAGVAAVLVTRRRRAAHADDVGQGRP